MKRLILITVGIALVLSTPLSAQQAGENINVLPVVPQSVPDWEIKGDGYLQRQVEPTIAASTRNPDHLLAFFNDYRAVDVPDDSYVGEEQFQVASLALNVAEFMMAGIIPEHGIAVPQLPPIAAAEAWVGMSRSYDGGLTWAGGFLPGADFDDSAASLASPVYGLEAATDPVLAPAPCGYFYMVFVAFTRGGESKLAVARYQDLNNDEGGDTITYLGTTVIETGNNADNGHFLDKPDIEVDVWRGSGGPEQCGHRVYVTYSTFVGLDKYQKFQSKVNFAKSEDFGLTYSVEKINKTWNQNQGSTIAIDPGIGEPGNKGGPGTIYVAWRHFFDPDAIVVRKSTNYGSSWATPVVVNNPAMVPFDQPTISTDFGKDYLAFRSNGFPTATVNDDGQVFVAWQERTGSNGSPRIVLSRSDNDGKNWTARQVVDDVTIKKPYNAGVGGEWQITGRGPQIMPKLSFGGGRLMLAYYESRGLIGIDPGTGNEEVNYADLNVNDGSGYITGYDRVLDFRAALLEPYGVDAGNLIGSSSIQVSRYPISSIADLTDGQQLEDVVHAAPCDPLQPLGPTNPPCARQVNRVNAPTSASGTSPFIGDYPDLVPLVQFVPYGSGGWKWATGAADVPARGFHAIFADNRNIIPPYYPGAGFEEWERYGFYTPPGLGGDPCQNAGSRNSNVYTSRVAADLVISTPTTSKQLDVTQRSLPFSVRNRTDVERYYRFEIDPANIDDASFSYTDANLECGEVTIFAYSGVSQVVYAKYDAPGPIKVHVTEIDGLTGEACYGNITSGGQSGVVTFSLDGEVENIPSGEQDIQDPFVRNPFVRNPFVRNNDPANPFVRNSGSTNYSVSNPFVRNPFVRNTALEDDTPVYGVIDTTWEVTPDNPNNPEALTNTASSYIPVINIDNANQYQGNYAFQLLVHTTSYSTGYRQARNDDDQPLYFKYVDGELVLDSDSDWGPPYCEAYNIPHEQILSNVVQDPGAENPFVRNPFVLNPFVRNEGAENPFVQNPFVQNPFVQNSAFAMAPPEGQSFNKAAAIDDDTTKADRAPNSINLTLRAFQLKPFCDVNDSVPCIDRSHGTHVGTDLEYDPETDLPSAAVGSWPCIMRESPVGDPEAAGCFNAAAADLVPLHSNGVDHLNPSVPDDLDTPLGEISVGANITFPLGDWDDGTWILKNQSDHPDAYAKAENGDLTQGYYLCPKDYIIGYPKNLPLDVSECTEPLFQDPTPTSNTMIPGQSISITSALSLSIPNDTPPGLYYLTVYTDDQVEISELNDVNNTAYFLIEVVNTNHAPIFTVTTPDQTVKEDTGERVIDDWATGIYDGDNDAQTLEFWVTGNTDPDLFSAGPSVSNDGTLSFTLADDAFGEATITVELRDDGGTEYGGSDTSAPQTFVITVENVNDAPVVEPITLEVDEDGFGSGTVGVTDVDGDLVFEFVITEGPIHGVATIDLNTGEFEYRPTENYNGTDQFTVEVTDTTDGRGSASITITIESIEDVPVAESQTVITQEDIALPIMLSGSDGDGDTLTYLIVLDPSNGSLSGSPPNLIYRPNTNFNGVDTFTFKVNDAKADSNEATVTVTVNPVNDAPVAVDDSASVTQNSGPNTIYVLTNDSDVDGDTLSVSAVGPAMYGTTSTDGFGVTYVPNAGFCGVDVFTYTATDDDLTPLTSNLATVTLIVEPLFDWTFVGLKSPLNDVLYTAKAGSVIPLSWKYVDSDNLTVDSGDAEPSIRFRGWERLRCANYDSDAAADIDFVLEEDPGSSDLRYSSGSWQFNWQSKYPEGDPDAGDSLPRGCYEITITSDYSCGGDFDGPFLVQLK